MRIGIDIGPIGRHRTGVGNYCLNLLRNLIEIQTNSSIIGFAANLPGVELGALSGRVPYRHVRVPTRALYAAWDYLKWPPVDRLLGGVDVFHATNFFLPPTRSARRVLTVHDLTFLAAPELCSPKIVGPFSKSIRRFARDADAVLADSEATRQDVIRFLDVAPTKVTTALLAADEALAPVDRTEAARQLAQHYGIDGPFLLFVGTLEPRKNVDGLLRAFGKIASRIPHRLALIGGLGWNSEPILAALDTPELKGRVIRPGFVPDADLALFYSAADLFVFPSFYEGFGLPVLEAMTCGCPVVASKTSSIPEVTGDAALLCDPHDDDAFAKTIVYALEDDALRANLSTRGRERAKSFSWRACAETTLSVYKKVAS